MKMIGGFSTEQSLYPVLGQQQSYSSQAGGDIVLITSDQVAQDDDLLVDFLKLSRYR